MISSQELWPPLLSSLSSHDLHQFARLRNQPPSFNPYNQHPLRSKLGSRTQRGRRGQELESLKIFLRVSGPVKENTFRLTYHKAALVNQEIFKSLQDCFQYPPSNAMPWFRRYNIYRGAIAQVVVERVFSSRKWHITARPKLEVTVTVSSV